MNYRILSSAPGTLLNKKTRLVPGSFFSHDIKNEKLFHSALNAVEILSSAINDYNGSLLVVSHDERFLQTIGVQETIDLSF